MGRKAYIPILPVVRYVCYNDGDDIAWCEETFRVA